MYLLPDQVEKAVHERMKGRPRDEALREMRQAVRDAVFLFHLHQQVNSRLRSGHNERVFCAYWLRAELRWLISQKWEEQAGSKKRGRSRSKPGIGKEAWKTSMDTFLCDLYLNREAVAVINARYFDGNYVPYPEVAEELGSVIDFAEQLVELFNDSVVMPGRAAAISSRTRLPKGLVDIDGLKARAKKHNGALVACLVDMAKAEALDFMGDNRTTVSLVERHVWRDHDRCQHDM